MFSSRKVIFRVKEPSGITQGAYVSAPRDAWGGFGLASRYVKIAEGFGLNANRITSPEELSSLKELFHSDEPSFTELVLQPEDMLVPPVPTWIRKAEKKGVRYVK